MTGPSGNASPWVWEDLQEPPRVDVAIEPTVEQQLEAAFQKGYRQGRDAGEAEAARALAAAVDAASLTVDRVAEAQAEMISHMETNTAALAVGIARELVHRELDGAPETVAELVREAVSAFALDEPLRIQLNPTDLALISGGDELLVSGSRQVRWEPDPSMERGGCIVEGPGQIVDGRLDLALERIYRAVTGD